MGGFELVDHSSQESIEYSTVLGDFQGDISLPTSGTILGLAIEGNLGYAATPVTVTSGNIKSLEVAGTAYAAITAGGSGLIQRFTTGSSFVGSISAVNFAAVGGGATGIVIGNECRGDITLSGGILLPLTISGALRGTLQAESSSTNTSIVIGSIPAAAGSDPQGVLRLTGATTGVNGGTITVNGDVAGRMEFGGVGSGNILMNVTVNGELSGEIVSTGSLTSGDTITIIDGITATGLLSLGDSLIGNIVLPALGLAGQVIINANDNGGVWSGSVILGTGGGGGAITLNTNQAPMYDAPHYNALPSVLGGGSIGLAPFGLHGTACTPPHDTVGLRLEDQLVYTDFDDTNVVPVIIRSYGPVTNTAILAYMGVVDSPCGTANITSMFTKVLHPGGDPRSIGLKCNEAYLMKMGVLRVVPNGLACGNVTGSPDVA